MDDVKEARDAAVKNVRSARDQAGNALDDSLTAASQAAKQTIAFVRDNANQAKEEGQVNTRHTGSFLRTVCLML